MHGARASIRVELCGRKDQHNNTSQRLERHHGDGVIKKNVPMGEVERQFIAYYSDGSRCVVILDRFDQDEEKKRLEGEVVERCCLMKEKSCGNL
jgi:hypothetical protein